MTAADNDSRESESFSYKIESYDRYGQWFWFPANYNLQFIANNA